MQKEQRNLGSLKEAARLLMNDWKQNAPEDELFMPEELRLKLSVLFIKIHEEAIRRKLAEKCGVHFPEGAFRVAAFHDCTVIASCRPGGGPVGPGVDAERVDNFIQMAFYSGWKKHHGFKYLTLEAPNGSCCPC
jgi:hypothetical protein